MVKVVNTESRRTAGGPAPATIPIDEVAESGPRSRLVWAGVGLALGLVLLWAAVRKVDSSALFATLKQTQLNWACGILTQTLAFVLLKTWRWGMLLRFIPGLRFGKLSTAVVIGLAANFVLAHVGEFLRAMIVARRYRASLSSVLASVVVERVFDFVALLVIFVLIGYLLPNPPRIVAFAVLVTGLVVIVALASLYLVIRTPPRLADAITQVVSRLSAAHQDWLAKKLQFAKFGLVSLNSVGRIAVALGVSTLQWSLVVSAIVFSGFAVGIHVSLAAAAATFAVIVLGLTLPNSPLQIGTTQLAFVVGFGLDGTGATPAIAASIVYTMFLIVPIMLTGAISLVQGKSWQWSRSR